MDTEALEYFENLHVRFLFLGGKIKFDELAFLAVMLDQLGFPKDVLEELCVKGEFESWDELAKARYSLKEYLELGINIRQAEKLVEKIKPTTKVRPIPAELADKDMCYSIAVA